jgi:signal transduction histidine kinase
MGDGQGDRAELIASRARIVAAADEDLRQLERDLREGIGQWLISLGFELRAVEELVPTELDSLTQQVRNIMSGLADISAELKDICRRIYPAYVPLGGLGPALTALARCCAVPVNLDLDVDQQLPNSVQLGAYYVVAEALTNTAEHAHASRVNVSVRANDHTLDVSIADDGIGAADPRKGSGLNRLKDRVQILGGTIRLVSPRRVGTSLYITIPLDTHDRRLMG